jgi:D-serine dehydratase
MTAVQQVRLALDEAVARAALAALADQPVPPAAKGFAGLDPVVGPATGRQFAAAGAAVGDPAFSTPLLVLRDAAIEHNIATMAGYCRRRDVLLAPHAKTTMSPEVFVRQLRAGAWALTAANVWQASVFVRFGARRVLIANEVVDRASIRRLAAMLAAAPGLEVCVYVDSVPGVGLLDEELGRAWAEDGDAPGRRLPVLIEHGLPGRRAGVRTLADGLVVARAAAATGTLSVVGAAGFEGVVGTVRDDEALAGADAFCRGVRVLGEALAGESLLGGGFGTAPDDPSLLLSAGGSHYFDRVADELRQARVPVRVVVRSGSYVVHDHGGYRHGSPFPDVDSPEFRPAMEVRASVLSRPQPDQVLLDAGRRDLSFDSGLPFVLAGWSGARAVAVEGAEVTDLNDQHAFVRVPAQSALQPGDVVVLGISHPCTTFDKWDLAVLADDNDRVVGLAHTFF